MAYSFRYATMDELCKAFFPQGCGLAGFVTATYEQVETVFGEPNDCPLDHHKVLFQWTLLFEDDTPAWIYPWRSIPYSPRKKFRWHVGGPSEESVDRVAEALGTKDFVYLSTELERARLKRESSISSNPYGDTPF